MKLDQTDQWMFSKLLENKKRNVYHAYSEYILCLKDSLSYCESAFERYKIESEIKKLEKAKQKFSVPSLLEEKETNSNSKNKAKSMFKRLNPFQ